MVWQVFIDGGLAEEGLGKGRGEEGRGGEGTYVVCDVPKSGVGDWLRGGVSLWV